MKVNRRISINLLPWAERRIPITDRIRKSAPVIGEIVIGALAAITGMPAVLGITINGKSFKQLFGEIRTKLKKDIKGTEETIAELEKEYNQMLETENQYFSLLEKYRANLAAAKTDQKIDDKFSVALCGIMNVSDITMPVEDIQSHLISFKAEVAGNKERLRQVEFVLKIMERRGINWLESVSKGWRRLLEQDRTRIELEIIEIEKKLEEQSNDYNAKAERLRMAQQRYPEMSVNLDAPYSEHAAMLIELIDSMVAAYRVMRDRKELTSELLIQRSRLEGLGDQYISMVRA